MMATQWQHCYCWAGVVTIVTMALLPLSMRRHLCHCHTGIVALIALALFPTLHGCCCPCCTGVVILIALTSSPSLCMGVITVVAPALLPPSSWRVCTVALVLLPLSHLRCHHWYAGISALVAQASLPLLCFHHSVNSQASLPLLSWHVLSHGQCGRTRCRQHQHQRNKGNGASMTRASLSAQWGQWCQHKEGNNASAINNASMIRAHASATRGRQCRRGGRCHRGVWDNYLRLLMYAKWQLLNVLKHLLMSYMDVGSSLRWLSELTLT